MFTKPIQVHPRVLWVAVTVVATLIASAIVATWQVRKDYIDDLSQRIDAYEKSEKWKLPETLLAIKDASSSLALNAKERKDLDALSNEVHELRKREAALDAELISTKSDLKEMRAKIAIINAPVFNFELEEGNSRFLVPNLVNIALISSLSSAAQIRLSNKESLIELGETVEYQGTGDVTCQLTLVKATLSRAVFQSVCTTNGA